MIEWEVEDYLQDNNVFINAMSNKPCHSDSYMTVVDYDKLIECFPGPYAVDKWQTMVDYWLGIETHIPALKLVALELTRQLKKLV